MRKRIVSIWFRFLETDRRSIRFPELKNVPYVTAISTHGRMKVVEANPPAIKYGIYPHMAIADARAIVPSLQVFEHHTTQCEKLLNYLAEWCIQFTPVVALDPPDGLILDISGCAHLWGGEKPYLDDIIGKLKNRGYQVRASIADTIGTAWALARYGPESAIAETGKMMPALMPLSPASLRVDMETVIRLQKLGLNRISDFIHMPSSALRRRFGQPLLQKLGEALGTEDEKLVPIQPPEPYQERLPCLEPIVSSTGIEIALQRLLDCLCQRLQQEKKGLRQAVFIGYRIDGGIEQVTIGTHRPSNSPPHLFSLFSTKLPSIEPALGIDTFMLKATQIEELLPQQEKLWEGSSGITDTAIAELMDRIGGKIGIQKINRYLPVEHYWPERCIRSASFLDEDLTTTWRKDKPRPLYLLYKPESIEVAAPVPDYPPMLFRYKGKVHTIKKADGPERIESEWWLENVPHRDYYCVEDENGQRYWLFRSGHYSMETRPQWFIHGIFA